MQEALMKSYDVIIIGAGHNGMAASIKLAKTGRKVLILESSSEFGGIASVSYTHLTLPTIYSV